MLCKKCRKEISDILPICPFCGASSTVGMDSSNGSEFEFESYMEDSAKSDEKSLNEPYMTSDGDDKEAVKSETIIEEFNSNYDGYYDDLEPRLASEINKIPRENYIKATFFVIALIGAVLLLIK